MIPMAKLVGLRSAIAQETTVRRRTPHTPWRWRFTIPGLPDETNHIQGEQHRHPS